MTLRRLYFALAVAGLLPAAANAANIQTDNFSVTAPTPQLAQKFGEMAEYYRREKAMDWLGREMPPWPQKCPLKVELTMGSAGGATTFTFGADANGHGSVTSQRMEIRGEVKQLLNSVLPHEITHTVLAFHFGRAVPRWADEGGSVLSENDEERFKHNISCREILNAGRGFRLRTLFPMTDYPHDMIVLYAQGYSVCAYLVEKEGGSRSGREKLLQFLGTGMQGNGAASWNEAARRVYGFDSVEGMEKAWLDSLKAPPQRTVAARGDSNVKPSPVAMSAMTTGGSRSEQVRSSAAPAMPFLEAPVKAARGAAPSNEPVRSITVPPPASCPNGVCPTGTCPTGSCANGTCPSGVCPTFPRTAPDYPPPVLLPPELPKTSR